MPQPFMHQNIPPMQQQGFRGNQPQINFNPNVLPPHQIQTVHNMQIPNYQPNQMFPHNNTNFPPPNQNSMPPPPFNQPMNQGHLPQMPTFSGMHGKTIKNDNLVDF